MLRGMKATSLVGRTGEPSASLLDALRRAVRARHYSRRTERAYLLWAGRFLGRHRGRDVRGLGES
ncbi:MAG: phage integrase N-terminal SAM-like domain-containing protein, partial [Gemmatimonadales bacterium]